MAAGGPSPLLAEGLRCGSPPLLAGVFWCWWGRGPSPLLAEVRSHPHPHRAPKPGVAGCKQSAHASTHTAQHPSQEWRGAAKTRARAHTFRTHTPARSGGAQPKSQPKHTNPHRAPEPGVAGCKRSAHTSTHTPQPPSQEWRGAAGTRAESHTPTPHTPARSGGVPAERAHKQTKTPTSQPGVAGRSRNPNQTTHTHTAQPSQEWQGTSGAHTQAHTHPNTPPRSGGAEPKPEPNHNPDPNTSATQQ